MGKMDNSSLCMLEGFIEFGLDGVSFAKNSCKVQGNIALRSRLGNSRCLFCMSMPYHVPCMQECDREVFVLYFP